MISLSMIKVIYTFIILYFIAAIILLNNLNKQCILNMKILKNIDKNITYYENGCQQ